MRQRDFTRMRRPAAADEAGHGDGVVRCAERSRAAEPAARREQAGDAPDRRDLDRLVRGEGWQDPGKPASQHRLPTASSSKSSPLVATYADAWVASTYDPVIKGTRHDARTRCRH